MPTEKKRLLVRVFPAKMVIKPELVVLYCRVSTDMDRQLHSLLMDFEKEDTLENPPCEYVGIYNCFYVCIMRVACTKDKNKEKHLI